MADTSPGTPFGKYQLFERLAAGGMAEIYRAKMLGAAGVTKAVVVKKILPTYADNKAFVRMFINEARIAMTLAHGNIAQIFDFGEIDGEYFIAMELVQGPALSKILRRAREKKIAVPVPIATFIAMEMCKGLHYAHTRITDDGKPLGIVHRDISPQNVIVSYEGQVKIVDFGIAKARTATSETEAGALKGKYVYFAPEQARGLELDRRTDVFAAGIVLYEMLTGRLPFTGKMIDVLARITRGEFQSPSEVVDVPPDLEDILFKAMAMEPRERYQSAQEFQEALGQFLYTHAPRFHGENLGHYIQYLYAAEIEKDTGRPPELPRQFLEQIPLWEAAAPPPPPSLEAKPETVSGRRASGDLPFVDAESDPEARTDPGEAAATLLGNRAGLYWGGLALGLGLVSILLYAFLSRSDGAQLRVESTPPGAQILVDGVPNGATPKVVADLTPGEHLFTLRYIGYRDFKQTLSFEKKDAASWKSQVLQATLSRAAPEPPPRPAPAPEPKPEPPPLQAEAPLPTPQPTVGNALGNITSAFQTGTRSVPDEDYSGTVDPRKHALEIPKTNAGHLSLDPTHSYKVTAQGEASLGGFASFVKVRRVWYYAKGPKLARAGFVGPKDPLTLTGTSDFYAFVVDDNPSDNSGAIVLQISDATKQKRQILVVDARTNGIPLREGKAREIQTGKPNFRYEIRIDGKMELGPGGVARKVAFWHNAGFEWMHGASTADEASGIVEVGKPFIPVAGFHTIWFFVIDDDAADNGGSVTVHVVPHDKVLGTK
jgi:serine/threonine protein kinase